MAKKITIELWNSGYICTEYAKEDGSERCITFKQTGTFSESVNKAIAMLELDKEEAPKKLELGKAEDIACYAVCRMTSPMCDKILTSGRIYPIYKMPETHNTYYYLTDKGTYHGSDPIFFESYGDLPKEIVQSLNSFSSAKWGLFR